MYITQSLQRSVQQTPDRLSVIYGDRSRTFADLRDRVAKLAGALRDLGVKSGDRVAILSLNSDRYHEFFYAVPWADAVMNPVNTRWTPREIAYSLEDSGTKVLIVDDTFLASVPEIRERAPGLTTVIHCGENRTPDNLLPYEGLVANAPPVEDARRGGDALAGVFYTGGTTGFPKGVMLSHTNILVSALGSLASGNMITAGGRVLHSAPMFHAADFAMWNAACCAGNTHVIVPAFEPRTVLRAIANHRVDDALFVPTMIQMLVDDPAIDEYNVSSLRRVVYGGSPISRSVLTRAVKALPTVRFTQAYGMTELSPIATMLGPDDHVLDGPGSERLRSGGRAAPHVEIMIVDHVTGRELPRGEVGEIVVRGGNVTQGYWHKPQETAAAIRDGWMYTGDGGWMDPDGYVYIVDRFKDMIVTGGENVYSTEVENAVATHPAVATVAVIGVPDIDWGERVHAVVVLKPGTSASPDDIRAHAKDLIAGYKAPRSIEFVDALPISGAGKILKRELRDRYAAVRART